MAKNSFKVDPEYAQAHNELGSVLFQMGQSEEALGGHSIESRQYMEAPLYFEEPE
jgi:hypothetical protein